MILSTPTAGRLYEWVADQPIVDVHNHLSPAEIADDHVWPTITSLWLDHDHYKWRAMRQAGVDERRITGDADPWERFEAFAGALPGLVGNPLWVWSHLELRRVFGIDLTLTPSTAREIYDEANRQLPDRSARRLLRDFRVDIVATTDDPGSALPHHHRLAVERRDDPSAGPLMVPTWRPDPAHRLLGDPVAWNEWVDGLIAVGDASSVTDLASLLDALTASHRRFAAAGCRASDHGLANLPDITRAPELADRAVRAARSGAPADGSGRDAVLLEVVHLAGRLAAADDGVLQLHLGPLRDASPRLHRLAGPDVGADVMDDRPQAAGLARFLGDLERNDELPRTVLYNLNPADNALFATMAGAFGRDGVPGVVQWGSAWWFNDTEGGMRAQIETLASIGRLGSALGMLTDSRSILSMTRHELYRRVLCDVLGNMVEAGTAPDPADDPHAGDDPSTPEPGTLARLVIDVAGRNARAFFGW